MQSNKQISHECKREREITVIIPISYLLQSDGTYLASGSYDGCARIWSPEGMHYKTKKIYCMLCLMIYGNQGSLTSQVLSMNPGS